MSQDTLIAELSNICPAGVHQNVSLAQISRWRIGGIADVIVEPSSLDELCRLRSFIAQKGLSSIVIGDTSNLLFADEGLRAICIRMGRKMSSISISGDTVMAQAGIWVPHFARRLMQAGLTGAEHTCGIPGTLGGLICMNGGSQRKGIGSAVVSVTAVDPEGRVFTLDRDACLFGYRQSVFQGNGAVVAASKLLFNRAPKPESIRREMLSILRERSRKFPRKQPNCGSVFKSNPEMYADIGPPGAAIEKLGLKNYRIGDALISPCHANFFVNAGKASADDMLRLILYVRDTVCAATGYRMEPEIRYVTLGGQVISIHNAAPPGSFLKYPRYSKRLANGKS
ncbi:UDP-N-acetylmuramate dehydrogenase [Ectothiorhodospira variabilis]|uniref:UDP-N-acetylmuramate dehydrogenase n=1 Tax=Ectothiorhodospira variabilis TaxID=505694 RepID=UPI001EFB1188|nr:UDP-N-acetylmuramate dehydrogenase [Ectothiorhodospira variabilis]MCG5497791.1 UDP-N-acetylmuramate dehydrogenase [Ectothiorhodospira variabilis]